LQLPSCPQLVAPPSVHWFSGSDPAGTEVQLPGAVLRAHDWQTPPQAELQQSP
jgi:hypothetical protein